MLVAAFILPIWEVSFKNSQDGRFSHETDFDISKDCFLLN